MGNWRGRGGGGGQRRSPALEKLSPPERLGHPAALGSAAYLPALGGNDSVDVIRRIVGKGQQHVVTAPPLRCGDDQAVDVRLQLHTPHLSDPWIISEGLVDQKKNASQSRCSMAPFRSFFPHGQIWRSLFRDTEV
jgi:hypothetical protein